jgi:hypothetical protein
MYNLILLSSIYAGRAWEDAGRRGCERFERRKGDADEAETFFLFFFLQDVPQKMRVGGYASVLKGAKAMQMSLSLQTSKLPFNFQYYNGDEVLCVWWVGG